MASNLELELERVQDRWDPKASSCREITLDFDEATLTEGALKAPSAFRLDIRELTCGLTCSMPDSSPPMTDLFTPLKRTLRSLRITTDLYSAEQATLSDDIPCRILNLYDSQTLQCIEMRAIWDVECVTNDDKDYHMMWACTQSMFPTSVETLTLTIGLTELSDSKEEGKILHTMCCQDHKLDFRAELQHIMDGKSSSYPSLGEFTIVDTEREGMIIAWHIQCDLMDSGEELGIDLRFK